MRKRSAARLIALSVRARYQGLEPDEAMSKKVEKARQRLSGEECRDIVIAANRAIIEEEYRAGRLSQAEYIDKVARLI